MSALSPKADMCGATAHVRFVPKADIPICQACGPGGKPPNGSLSFSGFTFMPCRKAKPAKIRRTAMIATPIHCVAVMADQS